MEFSTVGRKKEEGRRKMEDGRWKMEDGRIIPQTRHAQCFSVQLSIPNDQ
ncbi:hypothetical protein QUA20_23190 [Microcoleus sp. Pol7_A1]